MDKTDRHERSLLEEMRQNPKFLNELCHQQTMKLIIEHQSEFPSKLRPRIIAAASNEDGSEALPLVFLILVSQAVNNFFLGRFALDDDVFDVEVFVHTMWSRNSDVDTVEEVELAIRFFPGVLASIFFLLLCEKAVSFIPLFVELGFEVGGFDKEERGGLTAPYNVLRQLLHNTVKKEYSGEKPSAEFDEESLAALSRLNKMGLVTKEDGHDLMSWLFEQSNLIPVTDLEPESYAPADSDVDGNSLEPEGYAPADSDSDDNSLEPEGYATIDSDSDDHSLESEDAFRSISFIETRLRLLINWYPTILIEFGPVGFLLSTFFSNYKSKKKSLDVRVFEVLFELGMYHYPIYLGFLFEDKNFSRACESFGADKVAKIIANNNNTLVEALVSAANCDDVSLDSFYTLLRCNPINAGILYNNGKGSTTHTSPRHFKKRKT